MMTDNDNQRVPIEALVQQDFKKDRDILFGVPTKMIAALVTAHCRSIGVLLQNEKIEIKDITVDSDYSDIAGTIYRQESH